MGRSVLIIDESADAREVLRTALERRGMVILEAAEAHQGLEMAERHHPDLIVLDTELIPGDEPNLACRYDAATREGRTSLVLLGAARCRVSASPAGEVVRKPYHYGPLVHRIEELLGRARATA
jgi:DNA-binding response OmpR family regulator